MQPHIAPTARPTWWNDTFDTAYERVKETLHHAAAQVSAATAPKHDKAHKADVAATASAHKADAGPAHKTDVSPAHPAKATTGTPTTPMKVAIGAPPTTGAATKNHAETTALPQPEPRSADDMREDSMRFGYGAGLSHNYKALTAWTEHLEGDLRRDWDNLASGHTWNNVRTYVRQGFEHARNKPSSPS